MLTRTKLVAPSHTIDPMSGVTPSQMAFAAAAPPAPAAAAVRCTWASSPLRPPVPRVVAQRAAVQMRFRGDGDGVDPVVERARRERADPAFRVDAARAQTDPEENLRGFVKTRGSFDPTEEFVFWFAGNIYGHVDDEKHCRLFAFEGYNIGRFVRVHGGWRMLTREVGLYRDATTGEILAGSWRNPYTGSDNEVVHIWNDPVNQDFVVQPGKVGIPNTTVGDDIFWHAEIPICYPSPIPASEFPTKARSDTYLSLEMFQFFSKVDDLESDLPAATNCQISWVRVGPWLPWMEMGGLPGSMIYHCRGKRLAGGFADLPASVRAYVEKNKPEYARAPSDYTKPNETSWTYFKKMIGNKGAPRADGTVARSDPADSNVGLVSDGTANNATSRDPEVVLSSAELAMHDGADTSKPIYVSLGGFVFDVSSSRRHYRRGETYNCLAGRDATLAFVSGDLSEEGIGSATPHVGASMTEEQKSNLDRWVQFFKESYPQVGVLDRSP
jgi:predicted heme/steroid binding protein